MDTERTGILIAPSFPIPLPPGSPPPLTIAQAQAQALAHAQAQAQAAQAPQTTTNQEAKSDSTDSDSAQEKSGPKTRRREREERQKERDKEKAKGGAGSSDENDKDDDKKETRKRKSIKDNNDKRTTRPNKQQKTSHTSDSNSSSSSSASSSSTTMPRCTSPSHFLVDDAEARQYGPEYAHDLPDKGRADGLFRAVANMYYRPREVAPNGEIWVSADYDKLVYPTLDMLVSPLRKPSILDNWAPKEIALFEAGMTAIGKDFHAIQKLIKTKTTNEIVEFYYLWKKSAHYQMWKEFGKPNRKIHSAKEEQWRIIQDKMQKLTRQTPTNTPITSTSATHSTAPPK
jgi:hypothetical protein